MFRKLAIVLLKDGVSIEAYNELVPFVDNDICQQVQTTENRVRLPDDFLDQGESWPPTSTQFWATANLFQGEVLEDNYGQLVIYTGLMEKGQDIAVFEEEEEDDEDEFEEDEEKS